MVRHWVLVMLAFPVSLLTGAPLPPPVSTALPATPTRSPGIPDHLAGDAAPGAELAGAVGAAPPLLASMDQRAAPTRTGCSLGSCGPLSATCCPNLTNQR